MIAIIGKLLSKRVDFSKQREPLLDKYGEIVYDKNKVPVYIKK